MRISCTEWLIRGFGEEGRQNEIESQAAGADWLGGLSFVSRGSMCGGHPVGGGGDGDRFFQKKYSALCEVSFRDGLAGAGYAGEDAERAVFKHPDRASGGGSQRGTGACAGNRVRYDGEGCGCCRYVLY